MTALGTHPTRYPPLPIPHVVARLKEERLRHKWSQSVLADKAGVNEHTITNMERGKETPRAANLNYIAQALGLEIHAVPQCSIARAQECAEYLRAMGWRVEAPPEAQDARAAGDTGRGLQPAVASSTGRETACRKRGRP